MYLCVCVCVCNCRLDFLLDAQTTCFAVVSWSRCSICCSGVCLTATELNDKTFKVGLAPETLRRTNLGELQAGDKMNLERASEIGGRNSGHFVQGHVDGVGIIIDKRIDGDSLWIKVEVPDSIDGEDLIKYIVPKGFIAIDGTSLTVVEVNPDEKWFTFMLIEYTQKKIIIPKKEVGGKVNLEVDVLGKYSKNAVLALLPQLEALNARVDSLEADVEADIESLEAEVESLNARVESLEARVESLEARLAEIDI